MKARMAVLASGSGTNAASIIDYFKYIDDIDVSLVATNNPSAGVIEKAEKRSINVEIFAPEGDQLMEILKKYDIDFMALAGYLKLIPAQVINEYKNRILNIHPALLPHFGGKGMYGIKIHEAVHQSKAETSGLTIHLVTEKYDEGPVVFQHALNIRDCETPEEIAETILKSEHYFYPRIIETYIRSFL